MDSIEINTSKNWCMPFWAVSTRYSLVKGERIVRFVLTAWLHMLFLLVIATDKQSSFHFGVDLLIDVGLFPCVQKWVKQAMKQTSNWTPIPWLMEFVHTVIILEELESLLIQRMVHHYVCFSNSAQQLSIWKIYILSVSFPKHPFKQPSSEMMLLIWKFWNGDKRYEKIAQTEKKKKTGQHTSHKNLASFPPSHPTYCPCLPIFLFFSFLS